VSKTQEEHAREVSKLYLEFFKHFTTLATVSASVMGDSDSVEEG
jgi:hypothetical protein